MIGDTASPEHGLSDHDFQSAGDDELCAGQYVEVEGHRVIQPQEKHGKIGNQRNRHQNEGRRAVSDDHHAADDRQQEANSK